MHTDLAIINATIKGRRSIYTDSFIDKEIADADIWQILENANYAPTHKLTQPWRFTVFRKAARQRLGEELARIYKEHTPADKFLVKKYESFPHKMQQANTIIAINIHFHEDKVPASEEIAAVACAVQNMMLTAHAMGIGSYWGTPGPIKHLGDFLQLNEHEKCHGLLFLGHHQAEISAVKRDPIAEKVKWLEQ